MSDQSIQLWQGDCLGLMHRIPDGSVDLVVTSPPYDSLRSYNNGLQWDFEGIAAQLWRVTAKGGVVVWVVADATVKGSETGSSFRQALHFMSLGFNLHDTMIYSKDSQPRQNRVRYEQQFEYMFVLSKGSMKLKNVLEQACRQAGQTKTRTCRDHGKDLLKRTSYTVSSTKPRGNIWHYHTGGYSIAHPAIFPLQLAVDHVISWSNPGDTVLDCFLGSGTTMVAAVNTGRCGIGIERDATYFEIAQKRVTDAQAANAERLF